MTSSPKDLVTENLNPYDSSVNKLTEGLLNLYGPSMINVQNQLRELNMKQDFLVTQIHDENLRLAEVQFCPEIQDLFNKMKLYHTKLLNIKKDMKTIYERSTKLKKRALRLQQIKEKEEMRAELDLKREESLIGGPSNSV